MEKNPEEIPQKHRRMKRLLDMIGALESLRHQFARNGASDDVIACLSTAKEALLGAHYLSEEAGLGAAQSGI